MKKLLSLILFSLLVCGCNEITTEPERQNVEDHFESIKSNPQKLLSFFQAMPKGGDLHHHSQGSVNVESYIRCALKDSMLLNPTTFHAYRNPESDSEAVLINDLLKKSPHLKDSIINYWTVRNYKKFGRDGHDWFFQTFYRFLPVFEGHEAELLSEICAKAEKDNLSYIETMINVGNTDDQLIKLSKGIKPSWDKEPIKNRASRWIQEYEELGINELAQANADSLDAIWTRTNKGKVALRFQLYGVRVIPVKHIVFGQLLMAFKTAQLTDKVVGVNFLAPEDENIALRQYRDHMKMFELLKAIYPSVKTALHAGEIVLGKGETLPVDLEYHIKEAIETGGAKRIGHGVDILKEKNAHELIAKMKEGNIAVEINLRSNEVILETNPKTHPIQVYWEAGVPICLSTDDEGVLLTDLSEQYVLLMNYLPEIEYPQIKGLVFNTIEYSYLEEEEKKQLLENLHSRFEVFEKEIIDQ